MRCSWIVAAAGSLLLAACGSGAGSVSFGVTGDGGMDARLGADTGSLAKPDSSPGSLGSPDTGSDATGSDASCPTAVTCASAGATCGALSDGCGGILQCGTCATGTTCGGGGTANQCGTACTPTTCAALGFNCGPAGDGCGGMLSCGTCTGADTCGGSGTASVCGSSVSCVPKTCAGLGINCGPAGDGCGNQLSCGTCSGNETCGGGGTASVCGAPLCVPKTCASIGATCGPETDGCGAILQCGTCAAPLACGGGGKPGVCGCTGTCAQLPTCTGGATTTLTGKVYDPADLHPLYNVLVYIPDNPADPGLTAPFAAGVTCDQCGGAQAAGNPLVSTNTAYDGTFTLKNIPVGSSIPLVIQLGRWRREFTVNVANSCGANTVSAATTTPSKWLSSTTPALAATGHLTMPSTSALGDIPRIAVLSGSYDMVECELRKLGIADSEFVNPGAWGQGNHVQFYQAADPTAVAKGWNTPAGGYGGTGALINSSTPLQAQLFGTDSATGKLNIDQYDLVILECEGYPEVEPAAQLTALGNYTAAGGRLFASDFAYDWLATNPALQAAANWGGNNSGCGFTVTGTIDPPATNPTSTVFQEWLQLTGVVAAGGNTMPISPAFPNVTKVNAPTAQEWLYTTNSEYDGAFCGGPNVATPIPIHFTFNTPITAPPAMQCGRVVFSDWHATSGFTSQGYNFPAECKQPGTSTTMTQQETILEFMLFDATSCVTPYQASCSPESCAQQGFSCGPAGDGCGNLLNCGSCPAGQTCGGGGTPSVCGSSCAPTTCAALGFNCGPAGDGCGGSLSCGTCPAGQTCGGGGKPGVCGSGTCTPKTCASEGISCGPAGDGCGGSLSCGTCPAGQTCGGGGKPGMCGSTCVPTTCAALGFSCGPAGDGCGNQLNCGTCTAPQTCGGGGTAGVCGNIIPK